MKRAALLLAAALLLGAAPPPAAIPISRDSLPWWHARHAAKLAELHRAPVDLVFLGDSITQNFEHAGPQPWQNFAPVWRQFYGDRHAVNLGFAGDATSHLLWRLQHGEVDGIAPKAAVVLIGANNLGRLHWPAADSVQGIETVVNEVRRRLPRTAILLLGVLPSGRGDWVAQTTRQINAALARLYGAGTVPGVTYLDVSAVFLRAGALDTSLYYDPLLSPPEPPLHPSPEGLARLAVAIEPALSKLMGDQPHNR